MKAKSHLLPVRSFSLVELLAAIAVFTLVMVIVSQLVSSASLTIGLSRKLLDADDQARVIFSRMENDFSMMVKRNDVDILFAKQAGNDEIFFYSQAAGYSAASSVNLNPVSLVGYCIANDPQVPTKTDLQRLGRGLTWDVGGGDNMVFLTYKTPPDNGAYSAYDPQSTLDGHWSSVIGAPPAYLPVNPAGNTDDYHVIGDQVFRFEYCFLLKDGTYSDSPVVQTANLSNQPLSSTFPGVSDDNTAGYGVGSRWFDKVHGRAYLCLDATTGAAVWGSLGVQDVSAVVVALGILDRNSQLIVSTTQMQTLASNFDDSNLGTPSPATANLMGTVWQTKVNSFAFLQSLNIPASAASHIRIYQRYFYLNTPVLN